MKAKENGRKEECVRQLGRGWIMVVTGSVFLVVFLFSGVSWFFPMKNEAEMKRSAERLEIKAKTDAAQAEVMLRFDMAAALDKEAEYMMKSQAVPVREASQKARPLPLAPDQS